MRILLLTPEYRSAGGGISTFYGALAPALVSAGAAVRVIEGSAVNNVYSRDATEINGVEVETLEHSRFVSWQKRFTSLGAVPKVRDHLAAAWAMWEQACAGDGYDLVEASDWGLLFVPPAVEASIPLVIQCHASVGQLAVYDPIEGEETQSAFIRLLERAVIAAAGTVQTLSFGNAQFWFNETGCDVAVLRPAWAFSEEAADLGEPNGRGLVVGRVQRWKGPHVLCAAVRRLGRHAPVIDWVGRDMAWDARGTSSSAQLKKLFPDIWGDRVIHHSPVAPAEVSYRQRVTSFNLVPSSWDVFNFTAVESMASGRPTVVSTGAGASELIDDEQSGYIFPADDAEALAATLDRLLSESSARKSEIGRNAQLSIRTALNPKIGAATRLEAYAKAVREFRTRSPSPIDGWLGSVCRPNEQNGKALAFLDHVPLGSLASYVFGRACKKFSVRLGDNGATEPRPVLKTDKGIVCR